MLHRIIPIFIPHLGCPHRCVFCQQYRITGSEKPPSPAAVAGMIESGLQKTGASGPEPVEVAFYGGSFTSLPVQVIEGYLKAVQPYLATGKVASIRVSTRPDAISVEVLRLLIEHGVTTVELGVQSLDPEVLACAERGYRGRQVWEAAGLIRKHGLALGIQLMIGLPKDTREKDLATTRDVIKMKPLMVRIYPTLVLKGTRLHQMWEQGLYSPLSIEEAVDITADMFIMLEAEGIKVIRMGLQPTSDLNSPDTLLAGPFHPSFGELVASEVFFRQVLTAWRLWSEKPETEDFGVFVNEKDLSKMVGQNRSNRERLKRGLGVNRLRIAGIKSEERDWVGLGRAEADKPLFVLSRQDFYRAWSGQNQK